MKNDNLKLEVVKKVGKNTYLVHLKVNRTNGKVLDTYSISMNRVNDIAKDLGIVKSIRRIKKLNKAQ